MPPKKVSIVVHCGDEVLIVLEKRSGLWGIPKGSVRRGETHHDAAVRKLRAETGVVVEMIPQPPTRDGGYKRFSLWYETRPAVSLSPGILRDSMWVRPSDICALRNTNASLARWKHRAPHKTLPASAVVACHIASAGAGVEKTCTAEVLLA